MNVTTHTLFLCKTFKIFCAALSVLLISEVTEEMQRVLAPEAYINLGSSLKRIIIMSIALDAVLWEWPVPGRQLNL